jgi:hypothetical protein
MTEFVFGTDFNTRPFEVFCLLDLEDRNGAWRLLPRHRLRGKIGEGIRVLMGDVKGLAKSTTINKILEDVPDDDLMRGACNPVHSPVWTSNSHLDFFPFCSILSDS